MMKSNTIHTAIKRLLSLAFMVSFALSTAATWAAEPLPASNPPSSPETNAPSASGPSSNLAAEAAKKKEVLDEKLVNYTFWLAITTAGLFIVGISQAVFFYRQLKLMNASSNDTKEAAEAALETSKALTIGQRAYLFAKPPSIGVDKDNMKLLSSFSVSNCGHAPGVLLKLSRALFIGAQPPSDPDTQLAAGEVSQLSATVFPDQSFNAGVEKIVNGTTIDEIMSGTKNVYLMIFIEYTDGFGNNRTTNYYVRCIPPNNSNNWYLETMGSHNSAT